MRLVSRVRLYFTAAGLVAFVNVFFVVVVLLVCVLLVAAALAYQLSNAEF